MKYDIWKIKQEHHSLKEFRKDLFLISNISEVKRIIPGRISRQQKWSTHRKITCSYFTNSGLKLITKKWATAQEVFVICDKKDKQKVKKMIMAPFKKELI